MKKLLFLLPLLTISTIGISGCKQDKRVRLTYGSLVEEYATELETYGALAGKIANGENLLIAVYQDGQACGCWTTFKAVLNDYVKEYKTRIYYIARSAFSPKDNTFGLTLLNDVSNPTFALIKDGEKVNEYIYGDKTKPMFTQLSGLRKAVTKIAKDPQYYFVNQEYLDKALFEDKKEVVVHYIWHFCPDCNDCFPKVMVPYSEKYNFSKMIWIIDLAVDGIMKNGDEYSKNFPSYIQFLQEHKMSSFEGNEELGYDRGFVPTTQIWKNGELKDATVYFNDAVSKNENGQFYVSRSFYTEDRIKNLGYTDAVLEGKILTPDEVDIKVDEKTHEESYSWKKNSARLYHQPILESFFNKYVK